MSLLITTIVVIGLLLGGGIVYQLIKAKKAVTVANVVAEAKTDASAAKSDAKKL